MTALYSAKLLKDFFEMVNVIRAMNSSWGIPEALMLEVAISKLALFALHVRTCWIERQLMWAHSMQNLILMSSSNKALDVKNLSSCMIPVFGLNMVVRTASACHEDGQDWDVELYVSRIKIKMHLVQTFKMNSVESTAAISALSVEFFISSSFHHCSDAILLLTFHLLWSDT
jgi:hypothetical protein